MLNIEIRKLTPELVKDYVDFFDKTPHSDLIDDHKCYCVCWCNDDYEGKDFSTAEKRRDYAIQYVRGNNIQGYLAYCDDKVVGWCNANTKSDCLKCCSWQLFMGFIPTEETTPGVKVKSIFCFAIAPEMKRKGIAKQLLEGFARTQLKTVLILWKPIRIKNLSMKPRILWALPNCL